MAYIRKRKGKFTVAVRRKHGQRLYRTFDLKSDAQCFAKETELQIQQNRFRDISEASKTTLKIVLHRYLREIIKNKADKKRERSKYNVILRHGVCNKILTDLRTSDFAKYRDERAELGISNSTINRELSAIRVAIQTSIDEWDWRLGDWTDLFDEDAPPPPPEDIEKVLNIKKKEVTGLESLLRLPNLQASIQPQVSGCFVNCRRYRSLLF